MSARITTKSRVFNISSNLRNGAGLQRDYELLSGMLVSWGHSVRGLQFNDPHQHVGPADVTICLEVIEPRQLGMRNWLVPNSEWFYPRWNTILPRFEKILCKTQDCYNIWSRKVGPEKCIYIGFESLDFYRPDVPREKKFLHMAGKSQTKNTQAVCDAWRTFKLPYPLTVVAFKNEISQFARDIKNCTIVQRLTDAEVATAMNSHWFHIMPSKYEGFGHYIHEAIGCGGMVLTTNAPPMNSFNGIHKPFLIRVVRQQPLLEATFSFVSAETIAETVQNIVNYPESQLRDWQQMSRKAFLEDREYFRQKFYEVVHGAF